MRQMQAELQELTDASATRDKALADASRQLKSVLRIAIIVVVVAWLLAFGFYSGLESMIPVYIAGVLTVIVLVSGLILFRNWKKSEEMGRLVQDDLSPEERQARMDSLKAKVEKGDINAIMAVAQLQMNEEPREALKTLERVNLGKANRIMAAQVRGMRGMIHLSLAEVKNARDICEQLNLEAVPDLRARANLASVKAEAWARSGNPIEALELLDRYKLGEDEAGNDIKLQYLKAYAYGYAHRNDLNNMKRSLKQIEAISPNLLAIFLSGKRVHPLLMKEAKRRLEQSGFAPRQAMRVQRR